MLTVVILIGLTTLAFSVKAWHRATLINFASVSVKSSTAQNPESQRIEAEVISVTPSGFEPSAITRPTGPFILVIKHMQDLELAIFKDNGQRVDAYKEKAIRGSAKQRKTLDLAPGNYVLREINHSELACRIQITEK
ncbi:MAG TPA: hypothetical protein VFC63_21750 [Blastocatellia bacterium]|nr:hypothetical protein [Blastocatellia bacterium]